MRVKWPRKKILAMLRARVIETRFARVSYGTTILDGEVEFENATLLVTCDF